MIAARNSSWREPSLAGSDSRIPLTHQLLALVRAASGSMDSVTPRLSKNIRTFNNGLGDE
jgi:hypothetical protein